ncbi:spermatogenesis associated 2-like [Sphaeramia orbicularis]|uniref:Spermatogenesis-associated protein 2 PUB-like domain-containing protein n=1 Tax=Sphaeramia orbicularis TaxID=375764 RepID=A0A672ZKJ6_9TELE|nr:spermatogenesis-associated protein 2-like protein [Sphaeramia orbicularis]XP_029992436.1 spermatogenesis-associated protein 2-like protein [Sphaeramia orbicularis]
MEVMSVSGSRSGSGSRSRDLLSAYDLSLEQQILVGGSSLPCGDEELWKQAEELLEDGDAQDTHCLGLDPLAVMEESLKGAETAAGSGGRRVKPRAGLQGLAKAFEVLELAALNLYLGPWREEYKVVKMYSGMFTHLIRPVFSVQQIHHLFSLLGYQPCTAHPQQLRLQPASTSSSDHFLRWSCAFFLARCECRLLLAALGSHGGEAQWELSLVRERRRGHSVQVALDNAKKTLMVPFDGESDMDLYTDDQVNGGHEEAGVPEDQDPRSLTWTPESHTPAIKANSNRTPSSPSASIEHIYRSALKTSLLDSASGTTFSRRPLGEVASNRADAESSCSYTSGSWFLKDGAEVDHACSCLQSCEILYHCTDCNTFHNFTCALLEPCRANGHHAVYVDKTAEKMKELTVGGSAASIPMAYHDCCDPAHPDPGHLCFSCRVFHSESCTDAKLCQSQCHRITTLGTCSFGTRCWGKPCVLCRYCGKEYCKDCWFRNPINCTCGRTFDQSSSV